MAADVVTTAVSVVGAGTLGTIAVEVLRGRREAKRDKEQGPAQNDQVISSGARDAVEAIKTTLTELRTDLSDQRAKCDDLEVRLARTEIELREAKDDLAYEKDINRHLEAEIQRLKDRLSEYDEKTG